MGLDRKILYCNVYILPSPTIFYETYDYTGTSQNNSNKTKVFDITTNKVVKISNHLLCFNKDDAINMARKKKSGKKNTLICSVPGLWNPIEVSFENRKLPVCKKCKKIFKTRHLCRVRDGHTTLPWNTTYLCVLVDDSCIVNGVFSQTPDDKFVAEMISGDTTPPSYIADLNKLGPDPPICRHCKEKNYTRYHCRTSHCHNQLPWNTTYVTLKKVENSDVCNDSTDENTSIPNLDSPSTTSSHTCSNSSALKNSLSTHNYVRVSSKRSLVYEDGDHEDQFSIKKTRTDNDIFGHENITHISSECKAFILMMHEENTTLHVSALTKTISNLLLSKLT